MKILIILYCADTNQLIVSDLLKNGFEKLGHSCIVKDLAAYRFDNYGNNELAYTSGLFDDLRTNDYDSIVFLHSYPVRVFTRIKQIKKIDIKSFIVQTDFVVHSEYFKFNVDMYFVPDIIIANEYITCGIPTSKITVSGIPSVNFEFCSAVPEHCDAFGMILADGYDSSDVLEITQKSRDVLDYDVSFAVFSFDSKQYRIYSIFSDIDENFVVYGYDDLDCFKHICKPDFIISNSRNINICSAVNSGVPIILFDADGKSDNYLFLSECGCFATCNGFEDVFDILNSRFYKTEFGLMLSERSSKFSSIYAVKTICDNIIDFNNKKDN